jgi:serine/threonine kinase 32
VSCQATLTRLQKIDFDGPVTLYHFSLLRSIGKGAFGKVPHVTIVPEQILTQHPLAQVQIVQHKQHKALYALKYINKSKCVRMKAVPNIIQERRLLEEVSLSLHDSTNQR